MKLSGLMVALMATTTAAHAEGVLNIYNWGDYTNPELIEKFEKTYVVIGQGHLDVIGLLENIRRVRVARIGLIRP